MSIEEQGRPVFTNTYGIYFKKSGGEKVEGVYMGKDDIFAVGGTSAVNAPVRIFNDLRITRIVDGSTKFPLLSFSNGGTEDSQFTFIGSEHGTTKIKSAGFDLLHTRGVISYTIFDAYNFSSDLDITNINSAFNHLPMMAAQIKSGDATTDRGYPIQEAGSLIVIPGVYHGSSQIYGTYSTNRWFVRGGSNSLEDPTAHTSWKELATTTHLSNYLPLSGGTLTGSLNIGDSSQNVYNYIRIRRNNYTFETTVSEGSGILSLDSSNSGVTPTVLKISPGGHAYINDEELAKVSQIPSVSGYLPLSGGTLTRTTSGPVLSLKNTSANKEAYMDFYKGDVRCGYIGASASNSEDMYLNAYGSRNVIIGTTQGFTKLESGANNLIHRRSGTDYTILDTYNIASLTIQFNGSTNTIYTPNAAKTVNITPAAIGAAASSHFHSSLLMQDTRNTALYPNNVGTRLLKAIFTNNMMPTSDYWGGIHVHGWSTDYSSWELVGYNGNGGVPTKGLYFRTGILSTWNSWKRVAFADEIPTSMAWGNITGAPVTATRWPSWSEVTSKPSFATVATSGSYNDLSNKPSIPSAETAATIMSKINSQSEITFSKHVVCSAGAGLQSTSDIRFKSNFNSLPDNTLNKVLNAPEFTYNWKDEKTTSIGTSAQYWEDKIPTLVHEMEDGTKTFSYERYTVVLQKALKEEHKLREEEKRRFKEEIDSLNTRLNDLTSLIQKLI